MSVLNYFKMNDLNEASSESEELIARGKDDGDDIVIILVLSVRDTHKIFLQLASFLNKLFQYSGKDYCDSEYSYSWKDFEVM
jgi:hypothetical protein